MCDSSGGSWLKRDKVLRGGFAEVSGQGQGIVAASPNARRPSLSHMRGATEQKKISLTSGVIGLLTGPHQTSFSELASLTIRLSSGERPVFAPENAVKAPVEVMAEPVS